jgi:hypothetical protein
MKTKTTFLAGLMILAAMSFTSTNVQAQADPAVKVLPTSETGILKVLYAYPNQKTVQIKFYNESGLIGLDHVNKKFEKGFSKRYDLNKLSEGNYWVEITSPELSVTYKLEGSKEKKWISTLEKTTYSYPLVATN